MQRILVPLDGSLERAFALYSKSLGGAIFVAQTHGRFGLGAFWDGSAAACIVARLRCPALLVLSERSDRTQLPAGTENTGSRGATLADSIDGYKENI